MPILRAVIDTNVMVGVAFAKKGLAKKLRNLIAADAFILITSKAILKELYELVSSKFSISETFQKSM